MTKDQREVLHHPLSPRHNHSESPVLSAVEASFCLPTGSHDTYSTSGGPQDLLPVRAMSIPTVNRTTQHKSPNRHSCVVLSLHCMAGGPVAARQAQDIIEARAEYSRCTYSAPVHRRLLCSTMHRMPVVRCALAPSETPALACVPLLCALSFLRGF